MTFWGRRILEDMMKEHHEKFREQAPEATEAEMEKDFLHLMNSMFHSDDEQYQAYFNRIENQPTG
jgi:hypothetical protein